jgi:hypothetical protein
MHTDRTDWEPDFQIEAEDRIEMRERNELPQLSGRPLLGGLDALQRVVREEELHARAGPEGESVALRNVE